MTDNNDAEHADGAARRAFSRVWTAASILWLIFIAWRTYTGWPRIPLDMGGADPSTDAAYQAAQLGHVARALALGVGAPAVTYLIGRLLIRR